MSALNAIIEKEFADEGFPSIAIIGDDNSPQFAKVVRSNSLGDCREIDGELKAAAVCVSVSALELDQAVSVDGLISERARHAARSLRALLDCPGAAA